MTWKVDSNIALIRFRDADCRANGINAQEANNTINDEGLSNLIIELKKDLNDGANKLR